MSESTPQLVSQALVSLGWAWPMLPRARQGTTELSAPLAGVGALMAWEVKQARPTPVVTINLGEVLAGMVVAAVSITTFITAAAVVIANPVFWVGKVLYLMVAMGALAVAVALVQ